MTSALYDSGRDAFLNKQIDWVNDSIKVAFVGAGYSADMANDQFVTALGGNIIGSPVPLTSKSTAAGVANAANVTSGLVAAGSTITQIVIFSDTGTPSTSRLIACEEVAATPTNGGTIQLSWDTGANKIFKL